MAIVINSAWDAQQFYKEKEEARKHINSAWDAQQFYQTYGGAGQSGDWGTNEWYNRTHSTGFGFAFMYDPALREWSKISLSKFNTSSFSSNAKTSSGGISFNGGSTGSVSQAGAVNPFSDSSTDSKTGAEKEYIEIEFNTLTGDVELIPTKNNLKISVGNTIDFRGVGKYLSGLYFVSEIKRKIDKDGGYTMTVTLFKNGFGDSLKSSSVISPAEDSRSDSVDTSSNVVTSKIQVGDRVKIFGDDAIYSNAHEGVKVPNWVKEQILTIDAISEDRCRVRLKPIWSWTYVKFIKLV